MVAIIAAQIIAVVRAEELKCYEQIQRLYDGYGWTSRKYFPRLQVGVFYDVARYSGSKFMFPKLLLLH